MKFRPQYIAYGIGTILLCAVQAIASALVLYFLYAMRPFLPSCAAGKGRATAQTPPAEAAGGRIVVLAHPALQNAASWYFYSRALGKAGHSLYFFEYSCREASLEQTGQRLAALLDDIVQTAPGKRIILVGASLGGLISRAALPQMQHQEGLAGLITLACPHKGSLLAFLMPRTLFPLLASITYNGPAIRALETRETKRPAPLPVRVAFFSDGDELVVPHAALRPPQTGDWGECLSGSFSHMAVMLHPRIIRAVLREIDAMPQ